MELQGYINRLNKKNDFDLRWRWEGDGDEAVIEVYEEADGHALCYGTPRTIVEELRGSLEYWDLEDA